MTTRKPKASPTQHAAQAPIRKAKRAANQQKADARLKRLLDVFDPSRHQPLFEGKNWVAGWVFGGYPIDYLREFSFHPGRKWAFDCAFPAEKIAIEIDGGQWQITGRDQTREAERSNAATLAGWLVLHMTSAMIDKDVRGCAELLRQAFAQREVKPEKMVKAAEPNLSYVTRRPCGCIAEVAAATPDRIAEWGDKHELIRDDLVRNESWSCQSCATSARRSKQTHVSGSAAIRAGGRR